MLRMAGDLDTLAVPELRRLLREAAAVSVGPIVLELSRVTFLNCPALHPMLQARAALGERMWLENPSPAVLLLLRLTRLSDSFQVLEGRRSAASLSAQRQSDLP